MYRLNDLPNERERMKLLQECMARYQAERKEFTHPKEVEMFLRYVLHFVEQIADNEVYSFYENVLMMVAVNHRDGDYPTVMSLTSEDAKKANPWDRIFRNGPDTVKALTEEDCEETAEFMEWDILSETKGDEQDRYMGLLQVVRKGSDPRQKTIKLESYGKGTEETEDAEWIGKAHKFLEEYSPVRIHAYLDRFIIGQSEAKRCVSLAIYNHYLRIAYPKERLIKPNVLMIGPSGCGKTEIIRRLKDILDVPVVVTDFSGVVATPWKGKNKEEALSELLLHAEMDVQRAEHGIVFIDEFDKIASCDEERGYAIKGELQGQLLGMLEGTTMDVPSPQDENTSITMHTENILFICAGAFEGLERVVANENKKDTQGFGMSAREKEVELSSSNVTANHLIKYGFKSELVGRFGEISVLKALSRKQMRQVLLETEDSILERYQNLFRLGTGKELVLTEDAVEAVIDRLENMKIGARGLNVILHEVLDDALYQAPEQEGYQVVITQAAISA